jgi:hypothetical protein
MLRSEMVVQNAFKNLPKGSTTHSSLQFGTDGQDKDEKHRRFRRLT